MVLVPDGTTGECLHSSFVVFYFVFVLRLLPDVNHGAIAFLLYLEKVFGRLPFGLANAHPFGCILLKKQATLWRRYTYFASPARSNKLDACEKQNR